jgi:hypothetical protein
MKLMMDEDEGNKIDNKIMALIDRAKSLGFIELTEISDVIDIVNKAINEVNIILYGPSNKPILINAAKEEGYVSLAILDLNLVESIDINLYPKVKEKFSELEDLTTRIGYDIYGNRAIAPFLFPLEIQENDKATLVIIGIKSAIDENMFNENFLEGLLEDLDFNYDVYLATLLNSLATSK